MYFKTVCLLTLIAGLLLPLQALAGAWSPLQVALWHPAQIVPDDCRVYGLRINLLYGKNREVWGLDLGFANTTPDRVMGIQAGLINGPGSLGGIGVGAINSTNRVNGLQAGILSVAENRVNGAQVSAIYNTSPEVNGLQLGLINSTSRLKGLQIGLINVVRDSRLPFFPILHPGF